MRQPQTVWSNYLNCSLAKDFALANGELKKHLLVLGEDGWIPVVELDLEDCVMVQKLVDFAPECPFNKDLADLIQIKRQERAQ